MYAVTRRLDALAPVPVDCDYSGGGGNRRGREKGEKEYDWNEVHVGAAGGFR